MAVNPAQEELYTVVESLAAGERVFGFLGPRGMRLGASEVVAVPGDLVASLGSMHQQGGKRRKFDALERSLKAGSIRINSLPAPVLYDPVAEAPKSIAITNGTLGVVDPSYVATAEESSSSLSTSSLSSSSA